LVRSDVGNIRESKSKERTLKRYSRSHAHADGPGEAFVCEHCGQFVPSAGDGTEHRNHCPRCLWSRHLDLRPGDRRSPCRDLMEPIAVWVQPNGEWSVVHRCRRCSAVRTNRIAGDDSEVALMSLAVRPLARPAFPLDRLYPEKRALGQ